MSNVNYDIKALVKIKSYDLLKPKKDLISISYEEMFDDSKLIERLSNKENLTEDEKFLIDVLTVATQSKYVDKELHRRCNAIIGNLIVCDLDNRTSEETAEEIE